MVKMQNVTGPKITPQMSPIERAKTGAAKAKPTETNVGTAYTDINVGDRGSNKSWDVDVSQSAIDNNRAADFAAGQNQPRVGSNALAVQIAANSNSDKISEYKETLTYDVYFTAKDLMSDGELDRFFDNKMSLDEFKEIVAQTQQPMAMDTLKTEFYGFSQIYKLMTDDQQALCEAGKMTPLQFTEIQDLIREQMEGGDSDMSSEMGTQIPNFKATAEYKRSDITNRLKSGRGHNVSFGGKLMDRQLLSKMIEVMQGKGDGRVSKADIEEILPELLDGDKITASEENALLFGLTHCTWTDAAQKELASAIADEYPNSPIAKFGSLGLSPRFADYEQYHLPEFAGRSADLFGAKMVMNPAEYDTWAAGQMSLAQFNTVLERATTPCSPQEMRMWSPGGHNDTLAAMTDDETKRYNAGKMSPAEYTNISYRSWENESPSMKGLTPYQADYKPGFRPFVASDNVSDPKLRKLDQDFSKLGGFVENGEWNKVLEMFPARIVAAQAELGADPERFLLEALDLAGKLPEMPTPDNDRLWEKPPFGALHQVKSLDFSSKQIRTEADGFTVAVGTATLANGTKIEASVLLNDDMKMTSAVG